MKLTKINPFKYALLGAAGLAFASSVNAAVVFTDNFDGANAVVTAGTFGNGQSGSAGNYSYADGSDWDLSQGGGTPFWYSATYGGRPTITEVGGSGLDIRGGSLASAATIDTGLVFVEGSTYSFAASISTEGGVATITWGLGDSTTNILTSFAAVGAGDALVAGNGGTWGDATSTGYVATAADAGKAVIIHLGGTSNRSNLQRIDVDVVAVPEPSSAALLGLGGLALILRRRK